MKNIELVDKLDAFSEGITVPLVVYLAAQVLTRGANTQEAYDLAVETIEKFITSGIQATLDL
jgi:hypothetical protein